MSLNQDIITALKTVCDRVYAVQLPDVPAWPSVLFEVDTDPEQTWTEGAGYDQHTVTCYILDRQMTGLSQSLTQARSAVRNIDGFLFEGDSGDADYEDDPNVYSKYLTFVVRRANHV